MVWINFVEKKYLAERKPYREWTTQKLNKSNEPRAEHKNEFGSRRLNK
jgi:hypothetical protein